MRRPRPRASMKLMVAPLRAGAGLADASLPLLVPPFCPKHARTDPPESALLGPNHQLLSCIVVRLSKVFP